jgi:hypothetical protein
MLALEGQHRSELGMRDRKMGAEPSNAQALIFVAAVVIMVALAVWMAL